MLIDAAIFDLDGTLIATAPDVLACLKQALDEQGLTVTGEPLGESLLTPPLPEIFRRLVPKMEPAQLEKALSAYARCYAQSPLADSHPFPGMIRQLELLQQDGVLLFVASNKSATASRHILEICGMAHFFTATRHPDSFRGKLMDKAQMLASIVDEFKLHASKCIMVGDGPWDIKAAHAVDMHSAAALYGYGIHGELFAEHPEICLPDAFWQDGRFCASGEPFVWHGPRSSRKSQ